jgi:hypothetical protein
MKTDFFILPEFMDSPAAFIRAHCQSANCIMSNKTTELFKIYTIFVVVHSHFSILRVKLKSFTLLVPMLASVLYFQNNNLNFIELIPVQALFLREHL